MKTLIEVFKLILNELNIIFEINGDSEYIEMFLTEWTLSRVVHPSDRFADHRVFLL
jgi:hypothetical protein